MKQGSKAELVNWEIYQRKRTYCSCFEKLCVAHPGKILQALRIEEVNDRIKIQNLTWWPLPALPVLGNLDHNTRSQVLLPHLGVDGLGWAEFVLVILAPLTFPLPSVSGHSSCLSFSFELFAFLAPHSPFIIKNPKELNAIEVNGQDWC